jgi:chromosome segregation ATPase
MDELQTLNAKENKTEDDENRIQELLTKLAEINAELQVMQTKTESILRGSVKNELDFSSLESDHDSLNLAYEYIKSLYKDFASKRNVMRSEDELREFYRRVRKAPINSESMSKRWNAYMSE